MAELTRPDGASIHYQVAGTGPTVLVALDWEAPAIDLPGTGFTCLSMHTRYVGRSRAPLAPFGYEDAVADMLAVLNTLGTGRAHLVAQGLGCAAALRLLYDAPARVAAAVLLEPAGLSDGNTMDVFYDLFRETIRVARADGLEGVVAAALESPDFLANPAAGPWAQRLHDEPAFRDALRSLGRESYIALIVDFRDALFPWQQTYFSVNEVAIGRIRAPLLVVPGHDARHPERLARRIEAEAPRARCIAPGVEIPAQVADFLREMS